MTSINTKKMAEMSQNGSASRDLRRTITQLSRFMKRESSTKFELESAKCTRHTSAMQCSTCNDKGWCQFGSGPRLKCDCGGPAGGACAPGNIVLWRSSAADWGIKLPDDPIPGVAYKFSERLPPDSAEIVLARLFGPDESWMQHRKGDKSWVERVKDHPSFANFYWALLPVIPS